MRAQISGNVSPLKGERPASISYRMTPIDQMSARRSTFFEDRICSGAI
jgi:hypothetical protein